MQKSRSFFRLADHETKTCFAADSMDSRESFGAGEWALALPLVIFAQLGLVFFDLRFEIAERFLATSARACADAGGM